MNAILLNAENAENAEERPDAKVLSAECEVRNDSPLPTPHSPLPTALLDQRIQLVPLRSPEALAALQKLAAADAHTVIGATHVMLRAGQIVGYLSLGGRMTVQAWFDSKTMNASESIKTIEQAEAIMRQQGLTSYIVAVAETSPFTPQMERMGFQLLGNTVLWQRNI